MIKIKQKKWKHMISKLINMKTNEKIWSENDGTMIKTEITWSDNDIKLIKHNDKLYINYPIILCFYYCFIIFVSFVYHFLIIFLSFFDHFFQVSGRPSLCRRIGHGSSSCFSALFYHFLQLFYHCYHVVISLIIFYHVV